MECWSAIATIAIVANYFNNCFLTVVNDLPTNEAKPSKFYELHHRNNFLFS